MRSNVQKAYVLERVKEKREKRKANSLGWLFLWPSLIIVRGRKLVLRANAIKFSRPIVHALRWWRSEHSSKTHMIKLLLQMSHITFLPIQISHAKYVARQRQKNGTPLTSHSSCHSYLTSPTLQQHHIVQVVPISPSPPSPTSALPYVVVD